MKSAPPRRVDADVSGWIQSQHIAWRTRMNEEKKAATAAPTLNAAD